MVQFFIVDGHRRYGRLYISSPPRRAVFAIAFGPLLEGNALGLASGPHGTSVPSYVPTAAVAQCPSRRNARRWPLCSVRGRDHSSTAHAKGRHREGPARREIRTPVRLVAQWISNTRACGSNPSRSSASTMPGLQDEEDHDGMIA